MSKGEIDELEAYATSIEITRAAMCSLVVQRELHARRLRRVSPRPDAPKIDAVIERQRVTVHVRNAELKSAFTAYVKSLGYGSDEAAFTLFKMELEERWLFKTFGYVENLA